ncbi:cAMP-responsive element modulator isoform X1 [Pleuronectes platessa]|uniref:cAMP-responsive element modulator isoform X1 n=1 Tax=Pleuronectes platessa TaxID=8262 RepID=UPI00232A5184|nr:cAMP-responsive element modulator isoform X1 [Pleuronectes platessa]
MAVTGDETETGSTGDFTACQMHIPSSNLPYGGAGASAHGSKSSGEDTVKKREYRLMKNRLHSPFKDTFRRLLPTCSILLLMEAARQCRRKKKEYVKCLENRVAVLENQNKTLIEELRALKDIYRHKIQ